MLTVQNYILYTVYLLLAHPVFGPKRKVVAGGCHDDIHELFCSTNAIREVKATRMVWTGYVARMWEKIKANMFWLGTMKERDCLEDLGVEGRVILIYIFKKLDVRAS